MAEGLNKKEIAPKGPDTSKPGDDTAHVYSTLFTSALEATAKTHPQGAVEPTKHQVRARVVASASAPIPEGQAVVKPEAAPEATPEVTGNSAAKDTPENARERLAYLQTTLTNFLPAIYAQGDGIAKKSGEQVASMSSLLASEKAKGVFGENTKAIYGDYLGWLQNSALPEQVAKNKALALPVETGGNFIVDDKGKVTLAIPADRAPNDNEMEHLDGAARWLQSNAAQSAAKEEELAKTVGEKIEQSTRELGLPRTWIEGRESDQSRWLSNSSRLLNTALSLRQDIEQQDEINKAVGGSFPADLPPGAKVERDKDGKIVKLELGLPSSWRLDKPGDVERLNELEAWHARRSAEIAPVEAQLREMRYMPEMTVGRGELELKERTARLDASGRVLSITGEGGLQKPGQTERHINLVQSGYTVSHENGKVTINQVIQPQEVPRLGYLNLFGVKDVGKPLELTRQFNENDLVLLRKGKDFSLVRARELQNDSFLQQAQRAGEKTLPVLMDGGMIALGAVELLGAHRGDGLARLAGGALKREAVGAGEAYSLGLARSAERARLVQGVHGYARLAVGITGVLNNASARETSWGENLNTARSAYFLTDISYGLGKKVVSSTGRTLRPAVAAASEAAPLESRIVGISPGSTASRVYKVGQVALAGSGVAYSPYIIGGLSDQVALAVTNRDRHLKRASDLSL